MQFDKSQIIDMLKSDGDDAKVSQAQTELPDKVDTDTDGDLLARLGCNPQDLITKLAGGSAGGIGGLLG